MEISHKVADKLSCEPCNYQTHRLNDYNKHLSTSKHKKNISFNGLEGKVAESRTPYSCNVCQKVFNARNSLWYHRQKCKPTDLTDVLNSDLIDMLTKQNAQLMEQNNVLMAFLKFGIEKMYATSANETTHDVSES
jgi:hypothetical protein